MLAELPNSSPDLATSVASVAATTTSALAAISLPAFERMLREGAEAATAIGAPLHKRAHATRRKLKGGGGDREATGYQAEYDSGTLCAADPDMCSEEGQICFYFDDNPDGGTVSFDSVAMSMIPIIQAITFDTWTDPMFYIMEAYSYEAWIYFIGIAIVGGMFVVNLFLAVIFDEFMRAQASDEAEAEIKSGGLSSDPNFDVDENEAAAMIKAGKEMSDGLTKEQPGCCHCEPTSPGFRSWLKETVLADWFGNISTGFVVFNLVIMCMPYADQPVQWEFVCEGLGSFVTWVFIVEMVLKLVGLGCTGYWSDSWNMLDGVIVSLSIVEMLITMFLADTGINISFLRMLRLLRLLRLMKAWPGLYKIVMSFIKAIPQISNLFILMFLIMFIFSLLGMQTFGGTGISEDSRWHFDYFYSAMLATFGIFTGGWVDAFQVCSDIIGVGISVAFFMPALVIGFFIIMNLFIAILLEAFADEEEEPEAEEGKEEEGAEPQSTATPASVDLEEDGTAPTVPLEGDSLCCLGPENGFRKFCQWLAEHPTFDQFIILLIILSSICLALDVPRLESGSLLKEYLIVINYWFTGLFVLEMSLKIVAYGFAFTPTAYIKSGWNILDFFIVMISILGLFADLIPAFGKLKSLRILRVLRPLRLLQRNPGMKLIIGSLIQTIPSVVEVSAVVMVFHIVFAILGMQLFSGQFGSCTDEEITTRLECVPHLYSPPPPVADRRLALLGSPQAAAAVAIWVSPTANASGVVAAAAPTPLVPARSAPPLEELPATTTAPTLEPANDKARQRERGRRLHARRKEMSTRAYRSSKAQRLAKRAVGEESGGAVVDALVVQNPARRQLDDDDLPTEWLNPAFGSFDDFSSAILILFVASTGDGWEEFMWAGMDATGVNQAPERNDFSPKSIFFLSWMIVGCFIALNLFVGAIVDNFTRIKQESDGSATMTPEQLQWVAALKETVNNRAQKAPREPKWAPRKAAFRLINTREFDFLVIGVIIANVLGMACDFHRIEDMEVYYQVYTNGMMFFTYFYYAEFLIKFFGLGMTYFSDPWCQFDFFLVCVSLADQFFSDLLMALLPFPPTMIRVLRVARVLRILRLLKNLKGLRDLVMTLVFAFPALINVSCLLGLVIFMYAVLGLNLFTFVAPGEALADGRDFVTFSNACLLLFQCLTGDGWSELMDDAMINEERGCDPDAVPTDCGSPIALPYFISFIVIGTFVFLNLVVAVILENFTSLGNVNPDLVSTNDITEFKEAWGRYDPDADGMIPAKVLPELVLGLPPPLGIKDTKEGTSPSKAYRFCLALGLTQQNGEVAFKQVLDALINKNYKSKQVEVQKEAPPAVKEMLLTRQKTLGTMDLSQVTAKGLEAPLTERRFEMSRILAEELLRMFIRRKRETWAANPQDHPSYRKKQEEKAAAEAAEVATAAKGGKGSKVAPPPAKSVKGGAVAKPPAKPHPTGKKGGKGGGYDA